MPTGNFYSHWASRKKPKWGTCNPGISNKQGGGLEKIEIEVFLTKFGKMEKLTSDEEVGFSVQNRTEQFRSNFLEVFICLEPMFIPNLFYFSY